MRLGSSLRRRRGREQGTGDRARGLVIGIAILVVGLGIGYVVATEVLFPAPDPPDELTEVPALRGLPLGEAMEQARDARLVPVQTDSVRHPQLGAGRIVGQSPVPGQRILPGDSLALTVSLGPERQPIPDVYRVRGDRAQVVLEATGFAVTVDSVESEYPRGTVLDIEPEPGMELALPGEVTLTVSLGPARVETPLLLGLTEEEAVSRVDSLGLVVSSVENRFRFGLDQGRVIEQEPEPGTLVERGSAVRIVVGSRGGALGNIRLPDSVETAVITGDSPLPDPPAP